MKEFHLSPSQWAGLSRADKKCLHYFRVMEGHYLESNMEKQRAEMEEKQARADFLKSLPEQRKIKRR